MLYSYLGICRKCENAEKMHTVIRRTVIPDENETGSASGRIETMIKLKYGNTNTFYIDGLLVDTDYAGTLPAFYRELKKNGLTIRDIRYVLATHYHPDHMGLVGELMKLGAKLLLIDVQKDAVHFSDPLFERDRLPYDPIREEEATVISCEESRDFLLHIGIHGEIIHTPSHSADSVSLVLDDGNCFVGDLEPYAYMEAYEDPAALKRDWAKIRCLCGKRAFFAHMPEREIVGLTNN